MKFRIDLSPNTEVVPFDYMHKLTGVFHYWLGPNDLHGVLSLYSIGMLQGGGLTTDKTGLTFPAGASWEIGIFNEAIAERLIKGLLLKPPVFYGMEVRKVERLRPPNFANRKFVFRTNSPVILRQSADDNRREFLLYNHPDASAVMHRVMDHKLASAGLQEAAGQYALYFDAGYKTPKTKLIRYKITDMKGSVCPVVVIGNPLMMEFVWTVGAGELTGSGFGSLGISAPQQRRYPARSQPHDTTQKADSSRIRPVRPAL
jgi:CRISPR-associated endoribonuclease Cas6